MILRNITLENFGLYAGFNQLDLVPRRRRGHQRPIVVIGGKNGAGKTTLLEAVRLALYGRRALGMRVALSDYEAYLKSRINRSSGVKSATVALEFDYAESGVIHRYNVKREWVTKGKSVVETLLLDRDGQIVNSVPRDEWHNFLQELIPPGVSQLFFFDGEKIQEIAEAEDDSGQLANAMRALLGIELVSRLRTDLGLYIARNEVGNDKTLASRLEAIVRDIKTVEEHIGTVADKAAELVSARDSQARAAEQIRRRFVAEGGDAAIQRTRTETELQEVKHAISRAEQEFRDLCNSLLPFAFAPRTLRDFRGALSDRNRNAGGQEAFKKLKRDINAWKIAPKSSRKAVWTKTHWSDLATFLASREIVISRSPTNRVFTELGDPTVALSKLDEVDNSLRLRASALLETLERLGRRQQKLEAELTRADNAASGVMLDELRLADKQVGATEMSLKAQQEELTLLRGRLATMERERRRLLEEQAESTIAAGRAALAARTSQVLCEYERQLQTHRLTRLESKFVERFNFLARKKNLLTAIHIDPETFQSRLINETGQEVNKSELSAGEKQIYAIAMLWALAQTSGRPLPMIIDTPLARLDSEHRANLVEYYFPGASHQVVLLSTDTEIDSELLTQLRSSVSHTYRLDYDPTDSRTVVSPGYFAADSNELEEAHELQQA